MKLIPLTFVLLCCILAGCSVEPKPIEYGVDQCSFCKMTIVDNAYSSQLVTRKGRVSSFDAIECMVDYLGDKDENEFAYILSTDFSEPGKLIDATKSVFLISDQIPSPMGANISGFNSNEAIDKLPETVQGDRLTWQQLKDAR